MKRKILVLISGAMLVAAALVGCEEGGEEIDFSDQDPQSLLLPVFKCTGNMRVGSDFNGDGYDDVAIGSENTSQDQPVLVYYGTAGGLSATPGTTLNAPGSGLTYFAKVAYAGDLNDDGYDDLAVGANGADSYSGAVYIYLGSASGVSTSPDQTLSGSDYGSSGFGFSVAGARDLDNDGYSDLIVGAPGTNSTKGAAIVFYGGPTGVYTKDVYSLSGSGESQANFGYDIATAELNNDFYTDVVITENYISIAAPAAVGRAYVFLGSANGLSPSPDQVLESPDGDYMNFGVSVANVGRFDGDCYGDIVIGAYRYDDNTGRAYLYQGKSTGLQSRAFRRFLPPDGSGGYFGWTVAGGDLNDDGYGDVLVGETDALSLAGRVHVFKGYNYLSVYPKIGVTTVSNPTATLTGTHSGVGYFGNSLTGAPDVNGDGYSDAIIGAPDADSTDGRFYVFEGASTIPTSPSQTFLKPASGPSSYFANNVSH